MSNGSNAHPVALQCKGWAVEEPAQEWSKDVMSLTDVTMPAPGPTQVRIKVHAAGINPVDWKRTMFPASGAGPGVAGHGLNGYKGMHHKPPHYPYPYIVGVDGAGEIESVGAKVTGLKVGDRVMFHSSLLDPFAGSLCEYAVLEGAVVSPIPSDGPKPISYVEAAAIPCATWTVYIALFDKLRIERGRSIFIDGASGGVGNSAVQLARNAGLYVFASCSPSNAEYVKGLGADVVLDYHEGSKMVDQILEATEGRGVDYYFAITNTDNAEEYTDALHFGGAVCLISGVLIPSSDVLFRRQLSVHYAFLNGLHGHPMTRPQLRIIGDQVSELYQKGAFTLQVEVLPFAEAATAMDRCATGKIGKGKLVVQVASP
ncbi:zinc binding dehydrogenase-like protein [Leptomonas pyrrhocoris]|uniref:Zinc binding dehydrogenase-like protein n=1 Tax=Leptomonas pyrrhocoris TaxID=157538 RepID=A0A0N0DSI2_LEPPY|nr:zinc binding dehydrogenase-like protein [Leptomonas pyrrhocoris]KPA75972.1 zinc binding dehydrogenase-like protein [Leptomonas pyrrhocoris]|eukprot:XP_015654411.1 zinc binding dehydrogenase-like protein [Leptomonas pyrrhocoris]